MLDRDAEMPTKRILVRFLIPLVSFLLSEGQFRVPEVLKTHKFDVKPFNKLFFDLKKSQDQESKPIFYSLIN